jgi:membrane-associated phospholipid phosphatase
MQELARRINSTRCSIDRIGVIYLITSAIYPLLHPEVMDDPWGNLALHAGLSVAIWYIPPWLRSLNHWLPRLLGTIYLPLMFPFFYGEMGRASVIFYDFRDSLDPTFIKTEAILFGCQPSLEWSRWWPWPWFHELMEFSYFSYYFVSLACLVLILRGRGLTADQRWPAAQAFIRDLSATMLICYTFYALFPVWGPKYFETGPIPVTGGLFTRIMHHVHASGAILGAAFPSSHVAATMVPWWHTWKWFPRYRWWFTILFVMLSASTVYCRYHYVVDVIGGLVLGAVVMYIGAHYGGDCPARNIPEISGLKSRGARPRSTTELR